MSFFNDFIAPKSDFNRKLTKEEFASFSIFPNAKFEAIGFLGIGAIRPNDSNCIKYDCMIPGLVLLYNATTGNYVGTITSSPSSGIKFLQSIWDQCHSGEYLCKPQTHFGATYNCIGWSLGISKWLNPAEITDYVEKGLSKNQAIKKFITDKTIAYHGDYNSNFAQIVDKFNYFTNNSFVNPSNNTIAFYFKEDRCTHGARYVDSINNNQLEKWTSKLGSDYLVSHNASDLVGSSSFYGDQLYYVSIVGSYPINNIANDEF